MINGQRQTWSNGRAFDPATYWILSGPTLEATYHLDIYNDSRLSAVSVDSAANSTQIQILNLNGSVTNAGNLSPGIYSRAGVFDTGGNVYVGAVTNSNTWIGKFDSTVSSIVWQKELRDGAGVTITTDGLVLCPDSNIVVGGTQNSTNGFLAKISSEGAMQWTATQNAQVDQITVDSTNNVYTIGSGSSGNIYLSKYNSAGSRQWSSEFWKFAPGESSINRIFSAEIIVDNTDTPWISFYGQYRATLTPVWSGNGQIKTQYAYYSPSVSTISEFRFQDLTLSDSGNIVASGGLVTSGILMEINTSGSIAWSGNIDCVGTNDILLNQVVLSANSDIYTQTLIDTTAQETIFALGNNFSTTGTYNNGGNTYNIYPYTLNQEAGNINVTTATLSNSAFTASSYVSGSATWSNPVYRSRQFTPIKTNPAPAPVTTYSAEFLIVAGGGSGGSRIGGGGGAGGVLTGTTSLTIGDTYTVTVGSGGAYVSSTPGTRGNNGSDSSFAGNTSIGGGGGGAYINTDAEPGKDGGSGGGGSFTGNGGDGAGGAGTAGQGNDGGDGGGSVSGAGGGGAGAAGSAGASGNGGAGGIGVQSSITGTATYYGGGGGGSASEFNTVGAGGSGGGGAGSNINANATAGTANTGGGGGGARNNDDTANVRSGAGGSGVVIVRILTSNYTGTTTGSPTVTTDGSYTVVKFTASGSYTA